MINMFILTEKDLYQSSQTGVPVRLAYTIYGEVGHSTKVSGLVKTVNLLIS